MPFRVHQAQISPVGLPAVRATATPPAGAFGAAAGQQMQNFGGQLGGIAEDLQREAQQRHEEEIARIALERETKAFEQYTQLMHGEAGLLTRRGGNVVGMDRDAEREFDRIDRKALDGVADPKAQLILRRRLASLRGGNMHHVMTHQRSEEINYLGELQQTQAVAQMQAIAGYAAGWAVGPDNESGKRIRISEEDIVRTAVAMGGLRGEAREVTAAKASALLSKAHYGALEGLAAKDAGRAKEYLKEFGEALTPDDKVRAEALVQKYGVDQTALRVSNELATNGKSLKANLTHVHSAYENDPAVHDAIVQRLKMREQENVYARDEAERQQADAAWNALERVRVDPANPGASTEALTNLINNAPVKMRGALAEAARRMMDPRSLVLTDINKLVEAETAIENGELVTMADLRAGYYEHLSTADFNRMATLMRGVEKGQKPTRVNERIKEGLAEIGIVFDRKKSKVAKEYNAHFNFLRGLVEAEKPKNEDEFTRLLDRGLMQLAAKGEVKGGGRLWGDKSATLGKALTEGSADKWMADVPEEVADVVLTDMRLLGMTGLKAKSDEARRFYAENMDKYMRDEPQMPAAVRAAGGWWSPYHQTWFAVDPETGATRRYKR